MYYIYFIRSINNQAKTYVGYTTNIEERLKAHNEGKSVYTKLYKPWQLIAYIAFDNENKARSFEKYIKIGSGYAFAKKRFW